MHILWPLVQLCKALRSQKKYRELKKREEECLELINHSYGEKSELGEKMRRKLERTVKTLEIREEAKEGN